MLQFLHWNISKTWTCFVIAFILSLIFLFFFYVNIVFYISIIIIDKYITTINLIVLNLFSCIWCSSVNLKKKKCSCIFLPSVFCALQPLLHYGRPPPLQAPSITISSQNNVWGGKERGRGRTGREIDRGKEGEEWEGGGGGKVVVRKGGSLVSQFKK